MDLTLRHDAVSEAQRSSLAGVPSVTRLGYPEP